MAKFLDIIIIRRLGNDKQRACGRCSPNLQSAKRKEKRARVSCTSFFFFVRRLKIERERKRGKLGKQYGILNKTRQRRVILGMRRRLFVLCRFVCLLLVYWWA